MVDIRDNLGNILFTGTVEEAKEFSEAYEKTTMAAARNLRNAISRLMRAILQTFFPFLNKKI